MNRIADPRNRRIIFCKPARNVKREILNQIRNADRGNHHRHSWRRTERTVSHALDGKSNRDSHDDHQRNGNVKRKNRGRVNQNQSRRHENVSMREIYQAKNSVDHRVANRDERVLSASGNSRENIRQICSKKVFHKKRFYKIKIRPRRHCESACSRSNFILSQSQRVLMLFCPAKKMRALRANQNSTNKIGECLKLSLKCRDNFNCEFSAKTRSLYCDFSLRYKITFLTTPKSEDSLVVKK